MNEFIRNFRKQKVVGLLNICSLSLGIMVAVIVGLWAINELSYDGFHKDKDSIYRLAQEVDFNNTRTKSGSVFKPVGEEAKESLPQIEQFCRITFSEVDMRIENETYIHTEIITTDNNFFEFFSFELKEGDPATVLDAPNKAVLSEAAVKRYFSDQDPIGQSLELEGTTFTISGIMKDMPKNSSIQADIVVPFFGWRVNLTWGNNDNFITFLKIRNKGDLRLISEEIKRITLDRMPPFVSVNLEYELESLSDIHFGTNFMFDPIEKGNKPLVLIFIVVALVILIISCINFTNLFVSSSFLRARAVGIKKSQGAAKESLMKDFYAETAAYTMIALVFGVLLAYLFFPLFNDFTHSNLSIDFTSPAFYVFIVLLFLFTVLIAGTFPALYITRFNPIETLSGKFKGKRVSFFQKSLLILQFTASICLLIVVSFMNKQVDYMISQDLGFDKENVIYVDGRGNFGRNFKLFRDEMMKDPSIVDVTRKNSLPMVWQNGWGVKNSTDNSKDMIMERNHVQDNYFDFMHIDFVEGDNPFYLEANDSTASIVLNESAVSALGLDDPVGKIILLSEDRAQIAGVIKDIMVNSFHSEVRPQTYLKMPDNHWSFVLFFRITGDPQRAIEVIRQKWDETNADYPFEYHFLDDTYEQLYTSEINAGNVLSFAMLITFLISIAGLFAMTYYSTQRRIREIGLRKVNGATLPDLLALLNKDFVIWTLIAYVIAIPIAYFSLKSWLATFTVQTSLNIGLFLLVGFIAFAVTLLTTSFQTWRVANTNPVKTLKIEN